MYMSGNYFESILNVKLPVLFKDIIWKSSKKTRISNSMDGTEDPMLDMNSDDENNFDDFDNDDVEYAE